MAGAAPPPKPSYDPATLHRLLPNPLAAPRRYSLLFIVTATLTVALLPEAAVLGVRPLIVPVQGSRAIEGVALDRPDGPGRVLRLLDGDAAPPDGAGLSSLLMIDGNRDGRLVLFDHESHEERLGGADSCGQCHHMSMPLDQDTACFECHRDMYEPTRIFDHASHVLATDGNHGCVKCHVDDSLVKNLDTAKACMDCHAESLASDAFIDQPGERWNDAIGYMHAMHNLCVKCHESRVIETPDEFPSTLQECRGCHSPDHEQRLRLLTPGL